MLSCERAYASRSSTSPSAGSTARRERILLRRSRAHWEGATLLAITHDVSECEDFDRVLVLEGGRLVEDGSPSELHHRDGSRYRHFLDVERELARLWSEGGWRSFRLEDGRLADG